MGKKQSNPAVHMKARLKKKHMATSCIPHPALPKGYTPDGNNSNWKGASEYRELVPKPIYKHMPVEQRVEARGKPWYYLTKAEHIAIENRRKSPKMTHEDYIKATLDHKTNKWKKKHPEPTKDDLFYKEEHPKWVQAYEEAHDRIVKSLQRKYITKYTRPIIYKILESKAKESKTAYTQAA